ncbi:ABC transporter substrate-binding protein [Thalassobaculum fulvum]|jgi:TRAP-type mannitol/chloroaromatic compound transport system substrate-binding protein|uniref:ABC transporter substrate-binding protein n=1 Tax=Thalassobaculum fulvum TaxID=1633335 RepID=A0A918XTG5_9PROT|nr:TRAP transporter substrate-binding protein DctP [Thalassobaculum fulvum]GHD53702.1 ABC transporter substrate-binding protein [Thalassobaculum fulvum]
MTASRHGLSRRTALATGAALVAAPAFIGSSSARAQEKVTWKVQSHWPKASASYGDSLQVIADELAEITKGRFTLNLHGAGEFAKGAEIFQIVKKGVVEMGTISPGYILGEAPMAGLCLGVPGTFREPWEFQHYLKNMGAEAMFNEELAYHGVVSRAEKVYPTELVVSKEIATADDFSAMKLRSSGSYLKYLEAAGAAPQYVAGPELYQSLASGVVDGAHWGAAQGAKSMSLWEVAKFHMKPTMGLAMDTLIMNQKAVDALPEDLRFTLMTHLETRFWKRCAEYQYKEMTALAAGIAEQSVQVKQFPQGVLDKFAAASRDILEAERAKGGNAAKGTDMLVEFLKVLGYA